MEIEKKMSFHDYISKKCSDLLDIVYYSHIRKIYNDSLSNIFNNKKIPIIQPDYFVFMQYYFIYTFFNYISSKSCILYSLSLHSTHISGLVFDNLLKKYEYNPLKNSVFLKNNSYFLFNYLFFFKILFLENKFYKKILLNLSIYIFYLLYNINDIYKERLECINLKKEFSHPLKILVLTPNKKTIENIIKKTDFFNYSNYLFFINIMLWLFY